MALPSSPLDSSWSFVEGVVTKLSVIIEPPELDVWSAPLALATTDDDVDVALLDALFDSASRITVNNRRDVGKINFFRFVILIFGVEIIGDYVELVRERKDKFDFDSIQFAVVKFIR